MKPETRILRLVHPDNGGPRKRSVLEAVAQNHGGDARLVDRLLADKRLVMVGDRRGATYGLPRAEARQPQPQIGRPRASRAA